LNDRRSLFIERRQVLKSNVTAATAAALRKLSVGRTAAMQAWWNGASKHDGRGIRRELSHLLSFEPLEHVPAGHPANPS
jgi:hypothetical protein